MSRREIREQIFKILFRVEFHEREDMPEQLQLFMEELGQEENKDTRYIQEKYGNILERIGELDALGGGCAAVPHYDAAV